MKFILEILISSMLILIANNSFSAGHVGSSGKCYGYYYFFETFSPETNPRLLFRLGTGGYHGNDYYFIETIGTKPGLYQVVEIEVYEFAEGSWNYIDWWRGYTEQPYIDGIIATLSQYGFPPNVHPSNVLPNGCSSTACSAPGEETMEEAEEKCKPGGLPFYSEESCKGVCKEGNLGDQQCG